MSSATQTLPAAPAAPRADRAGLLLAALAVLALAGAGLVFDGYLSDMLVRIMILAILALSLELLVGMTGLISLGHAAFFGIGGYITVLASGDMGGNLFVLMGAAVAGAALYALVVGALSLRTRGVYFLMVTLAFAQMAYFIVHDTPLGGGSDGIYLYVRPAAGALDMESETVRYYVVLVALVVTYAFLALLRRSRLGAALAGIRANPQRMQAIGFPVFRYQLIAFVLAGAMAGLAGFLVAARDTIVNPEMLSWHMSGEILLMIILGGIGHLRGAILGAIAFTVIKEVLGMQAIVGGLADHWQLTLGLTIIVLVALLPQGLIGLAAPRRASKRP